MTPVNPLYYQRRIPFDPPLERELPCLPLPPETLHLRCTLVPLLDKHRGVPPCKRAPPYPRYFNLTSQEFSLLLELGPPQVTSNRPLDHLGRPELLQLLKELQSTQESPVSPLDRSSSALLPQPLYDDPGKVSPKRTLHDLCRVLQSNQPLLVPLQPPAHVLFHLWELLRVWVHQAASSLVNNVVLPLETRMRRICYRPWHIELVQYNIFLLLFLFALFIRTTLILLANILPLLLPKILPPLGKIFSLLRLTLLFPLHHRSLLHVANQIVHEVIFKVLPVGA
mmetsp:Transcript_14926/g.30706  ORF Transcript_14926/g.30706 Transcript_14926/m.30706 type:complete len:282 (+) Transcript_14926:559-1404(+)